MNFGSSLVALYQRGRGGAATTLHRLESSFPLPAKQTKAFGSNLYMELKVIRPILKMGDPRLLRVARTVDHPDDPAIKAIIADMYETMRSCDGAGLAAPQIGIDLRIMVFGFEANARYPNERPVPVTTLINPSLEILTEEVEEAWEGCLSVPGMRGRVPRALRVRYSGTLEDGGSVIREAEGFHARVFQHEFDHLNGILYPQRIRDMTKFGFIEALFPGEPLAATEAP